MATKQTGRTTRAKQPNLRDDLREFASARPDGWGHDDWMSFLDHLRARGHDTSDPDAIGLELERERLAQRLQQVQGVGPQRARALVARFSTVWNVRNAEVEEIRAAANLPREVAERVKHTV